MFRKSSTCIWLTALVLTTVLADPDPLVRRPGRPESFENAEQVREYLSSLMKSFKDSPSRFGKRLATPPPLAAFPPFFYGQNRMNYDENDRYDGII